MSLGDADRAAIRTAFSDDVPARGRRIREALGALESASEGGVPPVLDALGFEAHSIRGAAATAGLGEIATLAAELEQTIAGWDPGSPRTRDAIMGAAAALIHGIGAVASNVEDGTAAPPSPSRESERPVILHVEDNLSNLKLVERILARRPELELRDVRSGAEALELAATVRPSLVLLDLRLPDMSGEDVLRALRDDPTTRGTPVVVVSAEARPAESDRLLAAGADDFLVKPIDVTVFLEVVDRMVARARA